MWNPFSFYLQSLATILTTFKEILQKIEWCTHASKFHNFLHPFAKNVFCTQKTIEKLSWSLHMSNRCNKLAYNFFSSCNQIMFEGDAKNYIFLSLYWGICITKHIAIFIKQNFKIQFLTYWNSKYFFHDMIFLVQYLLLNFLDATHTSK